MTTEEKIRKLIESLDAKTKTGEVQWEKTTSLGTYQVAFPNTVVKTFRHANDYYVVLLDEAGIEIERVNDAMLQAAFPSEQTKMFWLMQDLYTVARRQVLKVDAALDSVLKDLE